MGTLGGDGYVYWFDGGNGTTSVCICPNSSNGICRFVYQLYFNKTVKKLLSTGEPKMQRC